MNLCIFWFHIRSFNQLWLWSHFFTYIILFDQVYIGEGGLTYDLGFIEFYNAIHDEPPMKLIIGLSVGLLLLIIIIILVVCFFQNKRKKKKDKRYHELVQLRMDRMESQYARECKEGRLHFIVKNVKFFDNKINYKIVYSSLPYSSIIEIIFKRRNWFWVGKLVFKLQIRKYKELSTNKQLSVAVYFVIF